MTERCAALGLVFVDPSVTGAGTKKERVAFVQVGCAPLSARPNRASADCSQRPPAPRPPRPACLGWRLQCMMSVDRCLRAELSSPLQQEVITPLLRKVALLSGEVAAARCALRCFWRCL